MLVTPEKQRQGIQSVELGYSLIRTLANNGRPMMLRDIARASAIAPAKAHQYLVSFLRLGLISQDSASGRYDLGPAALELGMAALGRLDPVRLAGPILEDLCESVGETVALAVWGNRGPTIVRIVDSGGPVTVTLRAGTVLPLHNSATGRAFAAFHRSPFVRRILDEELRAAAATSRVAITTLRRHLERTLSEIRERGISRATGSLTPGINGFSAPVHDHTGSMTAAITALGPVGEFNVEWESPVAQAMRTSAAGLSGRLGYGSMRE